MALRTVTPANRAALLDEAAAELNRGGLVVIPTDTVYGIALHPAFPAALERLYAVKGRPDDKPVALLAASADAIEAFGGRLTAAARRLAGACWPGALTLVVDCRGAREGFRVPDHPFTRELLSRCGGLLRVSSANHAGRPPALTGREAFEALGQAVDLVIDDGPARGGAASTVVLAAGGACRILREGAIPADRLAAVNRGSLDEPEASRPLLLFVCSGNTCRSPMGAALMRARLPADTRWRVASAGTHAVAGLPATPQACQAMAEININLTGHSSRPLTREQIGAAALLVTMGRSHFDHAVELVPSARDRIFPLRRFAARPDGLDIEDPIGGSLQDYRNCRDAISACLPGLHRFLDEQA